MNLIVKCIMNEYHIKKNCKGSAVTCINRGTVCNNCYTWCPAIVTHHPPRSSALYYLNLVSVCSHVRVPDTGSILKLRTYAVRSCWFLVGIFLRKMSKVLLALFGTRLMFLLQFRSSDISTPRYQADEVFTYTCPSSMYLVQMSSGYRYMDNLTLPYPTVFPNAQFS